MTRPTTPSNQEGPTDAPPRLPEGWLAQWEGQSRKYYYVQRATGHSQWDIPTQPALSVPTPLPTPQPVTAPFQGPPMPGDSMSGTENGGGARGFDGAGEQYEGADRGFLSDLATNAMGGKHNKPQNQSGMGGLASSLLGGQGSHGGNGQGGSGGLLGGKQHNQPSGQGQSGGQGQGGLMGMVSGFLGGHHGSGGSSNNYGYSCTGQSSGSYSGEAPPVAYKPSGQPSPSQYGSAGHDQSTNPGQQPGVSSAQGHPESSTYGNPSQVPSYGNTSQGAPYGQTNPTSYESFGQQPHLSMSQPHQPSFSSPPSAPYDTSASHTPYGQQNPSYPPQPQMSGYDQYPQHSQQGQYSPQPHDIPAYPGPQHSQQGQYSPQPHDIPAYPGPQHSQQGQYSPHPHDIPAYPGPQPGGYTPYAPNASMASHSHQQNSIPEQYPGQNPSGGYPGQPNYGAAPNQGYAHQSYGQQQHTYGGYGQQQPHSSAPPAPGWRA